MPSIDETELARLEALAKDATPTPWIGTIDQSHFYTFSTILGGEKKQSRGLNHQLIVQVGGWATVREQQANTRYIAAACNNVPALIAEIRRLREDRAAMLSDMGAVKTKAEPCDDCWTIYMLMREMGIEGKNWFHRDVCARLKAMQNAEEENAALREKVEAWE